MRLPSHVLDRLSPANMDEALQRAQSMGINASGDPAPAPGQGLGGVTLRPPHMGVSHEGHEGYGVLCWSGEGS